jgi:hypothetical protein
VLVLDLENDAIPGEVREVKDGKVTVEFTNSNAAIRPAMRADVRLKLD